MAARKATKKKSTRPSAPRVRARPALPRAPRPEIPPTIGWTEYVSFPAWGIHAIKAKVDTGAGISALHVDSIRELGNGTVRFEVVLHRTQRHLRVTAEAAVLRRSRIKSSNGAWTERYVVTANMKLGPIERRIEVSLVSRPEMVYRMLLGRGALSGLLIDAGSQCLLGVPRRTPAKDA